LQQDSFNFSKSLVVDNQEKILLKNELAKPQTTVLTAKNTQMTHAKVAAQSLPDKLKKHSAAIPEDIYLSLTSPVSDEAKKSEILPASPADIMLAMAAQSNDVVSSNVTVASTSASEKKLAAKTVSNDYHKPLIINNAYYADKKGYVIQIAAFSELQLPKAFLNTLADVEYKAYQRLLNDKAIMVITSNAYAERAAAEFALSKLPKALLERQPWLKSVTVVNNEINAFLSSQ
jgi:DamX protein